MDKLSFFLLRDEMGLSQKKIAELLNLTQGAISHYELGKRRIPALVKNKISRLYEEYEVDLQKKRIQARARAKLKLKLKRKEEGGITA